MSYLTFENDEMVLCKECFDYVPRKSSIRDGKNNGGYLCLKCREKLKTQNI